MREALQHRQAEPLHARGIHGERAGRVGRRDRRVTRAGLVDQREARRPQLPHPPRGRRTGRGLDDADQPEPERHPLPPQALRGLQQREVVLASFQTADAQHLRRAHRRGRGRNHRRHVHPERDRHHRRMIPDPLPSPVGAQRVARRLRHGRHAIEPEQLEEIGRKARHGAGRAELRVLQRDRVVEDRDRRTLRGRQQVGQRRRHRGREHLRHQQPAVGPQRGIHGRGPRAQRTGEPAPHARRPRPARPASPRGSGGGQVGLLPRREEPPAARVWVVGHGPRRGAKFTPEGAAHPLDARPRPGVAGMAEIEQERGGHGGGSHGRGAGAVKGPSSQRPTVPRRVTSRQGPGQRRKAASRSASNSRARTGRPTSAARCA